MGISFTFVTLGFVLFVTILLFLLYRDIKKKFEGFPVVHIFIKAAYALVMGKIPKDVPFNNYIFQCINNACKQHSEEGLFMTFLSRPVLFLFKEDAVRFFLNEKAASDKSPEYGIIEEALGAGLLSSNGERWKAHRKLINPVFHIGMLKDKVPIFNEHALALAKDLENLVGKQSTDIIHVLKKHFFNSISEAVLGFKQHEGNKDISMKIFHLVHSMSEMVLQRIYSPWLRSKILLNISSFGRKYQKNLKEAKETLLKVIHDMEKQLASNGSVDPEHFSKHFKKSFSYILFSQHLKDPSFTFEDLRDEVATIMVGGYDTSTYACLWCLFVLGHHPEVQEKVFNEVQSSSNSYITYEESCNFTYLEAVIMETLRLYPSIPMFGRNLTKDVQYGKYKVHKNTTIFFLPYMLHKDPDVFPDPENFEPERFLNSESCRPGSFIPFSEGPRACIGKKYAIIQLRIFLAYIIRNFKIISLDRKEDVSLHFSVTLTPVKDLRMEFTRRHPEHR